MPAFKFKLSQPVMVPGESGVQGRVSGRTEFVGQPNIYQVIWLDAKLGVQSKVCTEDELIGAWGIVPEPVELQAVTGPKMSSPRFGRKRSRSKRRAKR